jgi:hypothetical protein
MLTMAQGEATRVTNAVERLDAAAVWLVADGIAMERSDGAAALKSALIAGPKVKLWVTPQVDPDKGLAAFRIKAAGVGLDLQLVQAAQAADGRIYEQWVGHLSSEDWVEGAPRNMGCRFYLALRLGGPDARRQVMRGGLTYREAFAQAPVAFPVDDPAVLFRLQAWDHAPCFEGSQVPADRIGPDGKGGYLRLAAVLPPLFLRAVTGDRAGVSALLDQGAPVDQPGTDGATPALAAALVDDWTTVRLLLERGANPMAADVHGHSLPWLVAQAPAGRGSRDEEGLAAVRGLLNDRALLEKVHEPVEVRFLMVEGRWPPV